MDEDNIPTKKFKVSFEFDAIPYDEETYDLLGDHFFPEWPEDIYAKEDVGELFQKAIFGIGVSTLTNDRPYFSRFMKMVEQMRSTVKIEIQ
jgi:hypothetical protein